MGGDETTDTTAAATVAAPTTLSKADLITQGDAICAEVNAAVGSLSSTASEGASRAAQEADLYGGMVERLKGLGTPEEPEGYEEFIAAADELAQAQSNAALAAERGEAEALATAQTEASAALSSFQTAAGDYGFEDCTEAPSAPVPSGTAGAPEEAESETGGVEEGVEEEAAPEAVEEPAPEAETGGAGSTEAGGGTGGGDRRIRRFFLRRHRPRLSAYLVRDADSPRQTRKSQQFASHAAEDCSQAP